MDGARQLAGVFNLLDRLPEFSQHEPGGFMFHVDAGGELFRVDSVRGGEQFYGRGPLGERGPGFVHDGAGG